MPFEVPLSLIVDQPSFDQGVQLHIKALTDFTKTRGKPRPVAHPLIEKSVKRVVYPVNQKKPDSYVADYTFKDDTPKIEPLTLEDKKNRLVALLHNAAIAAKNKILPQRKFRLFLLNVKDAVDKKEVDRSDADKALIAEHNDIQTKWNVIDRKLAEAESAIEDLTDDTVDSWQVPQLG